jgi:hypothetical protein
MRISNKIKGLMVGAAGFEPANTHCNNIISFIYFLNGGCLEDFNETNIAFAYKVRGLKFIWNH